MDIQKTQNGDKTVLAISGRLDTATAPQLQEALIPEFDNTKSVTLDFAGLSYVSSAGLRILLIGQKTAKAKGGIFKLIHVSDEIMEVLEMTGFSNILVIEQ